MADELVRRFKALADLDLNSPLDVVRSFLLYLAMIMSVQVVIECLR